VVTVEDSGIGFEPQAGARLFRPYAQAATPAGPNRSPAGLGIGLSLVQGIVALHGGTVEARSAGPGQGAEFIVRLPLARVEGRAGVREAGRDAPRAAVHAPFPGFRVLVADDNKDAADSLQRLLAHAGYEVAVAYEGGAALQLGRSFAPRVAVLDIGMPSMNGYELARELRELYGDDIVLVALTGWGQENDRRRAMEAGFDRHLTKPLDPAVLVDLFAELGAREERKAG
jgi:CheY-like chemotaxis protein